MDRDYVIGYLREALDLLAQCDPDDDWDFTQSMESRAEFNRRLHHVRAVVRNAAPGLERSVHPARVRYVGETMTAIEQAIYALEEGQEVMRRLGPKPGPSLRADALHPTVWDAAMSFWRSNHRRQAVEQAAKSVNAALQDRLGRRDVDNTTLVEQAFSLNDPEPEKPRLRLWPDDGSATYRDVHVGAMSFGKGCFMALRNPSAHVDLPEMSEKEALEQLAAWSVLARWIEEATVQQADDAERPPAE